MSGDAADNRVDRDVAQVLADLHSEGADRAATVHELHTLANAEAAADPGFAAALRGAAGRLAALRWAPADVRPGAVTAAPSGGASTERDSPDLLAARPDDDDVGATDDGAVDAAVPAVERPVVPHPDYPPGFNPALYIRDPLPDQRPDRPRRNA